MHDTCKFVFAIPLKPRVACDDWEVVQDNLRRTIRSIRGTRNAEYFIAIACHDVPDLHEGSGSDLSVLTVPFAPESDVVQGGEDKIRKRHFIGAWLRENLKADAAYVMFLDADDLVHKDVVCYVLSDDNRRSYVAERGYEYDCRTGILGRRTRGFPGVCGSCFISYFQKDELPRSWDDKECAYTQFTLHREYDIAAAGLGKNADPIPFHAVIYLANHRESLRLKRPGGRLRELDLFNLVWPGQARAILVNDFSVSDDDRPVTGVAGIGSFACGVLASSFRRIRRRVNNYVFGAVPAPGPR